MGQLEKYGLYVLCLVIFLILGVALWGDPAAAAGTDQRRGAQTQAQASAPATQFDLNDFKELMSPAPTPRQPARSESGVEPGVDPGANGNGAGNGAPAPTIPAVATPPAPPRQAPLAATLSTERSKYTIVSGDTLGAIAMDRLGSTRHQGLIEKLNPGLHADRLMVGKEITLPSPAEVAAAGGAATSRGQAAQPQATRTYTIVRGDTLEGLAVRLLGSAGRVDDIKKLNPGIDPRTLRIGQHINVPAD